MVGVPSWVEAVGFVADPVVGRAWSAVAETLGVGVAVAAGMATVVAVG
ncbi:MAG: hypothetical protein M0Z94_14905 [Dehalococcoidales bacterium]|nr:hypothetical protein [Dehalococcoidales bacterium]